jgi:transcriptional regulator with XRE-family HTH domain
LSGRDTVMCLRCLELVPDVSFGQRLRSGRLTLGMSLRQLATESDVAATSLSLYERGVVEPTWSILLRLISVLGAKFVTAGLQPAGTPRMAQEHTTDADRPETPRRSKRGRPKAWRSR